MSGKYKYPYKVSQSVPPCMFLVSSPVTYSTSWLSNMAKLDKMSSLYFCSVVTGPNASSDINMSLNPIPL